MFRTSRHLLLPIVQKISDQFITVQRSESCDLNDASNVAHVSVSYLLKQGRALSSSSSSSKGTRKITDPGSTQILDGYVSNLGKTLVVDVAPVDESGGSVDGMHRIELALAQIEKDWFK